MAFGLKLGASLLSRVSRELLGVYASADKLTLYGKKTAARVGHVRVAYALHANPYSPGNELRAAEAFFDLFRIASDFNVHLPIDACLQLAFIPAHVSRAIATARTATSITHSSEHDLGAERPRGRPATGGKPLRVSVANSAAATSLAPLANSASPPRRDPVVVPDDPA